MFEVGRDYVIHTLDDGYSEELVESYSTYEVIGWEMPLLHLRQFNKETVLNVTNPRFIRAEKVLREDEKQSFEVRIERSDPDL